MKGGSRRSVKLSNWRCLDPAFRGAFEEIARRLGRRPSSLVRSVAAKRDPGQQLSSALRVFVLEDTRARVQDIKEHAAELRLTIQDLIGDQAETVRDGHAPISAVIAGARANG